MLPWVLYHIDPIEALKGYGNPFEVPMFTTYSALLYSIPYLVVAILSQDYLK